MTEAHLGEVAGFVLQSLEPASGGGVLSPAHFAEALAKLQACKDSDRESACAELFALAVRFRRQGVLVTARYLFLLILHALGSERIDVMAAAAAVPSSEIRRLIESRGSPGGTPGLLRPSAGGALGPRAARAQRPKKQV